MNSARSSSTVMVEKTSQTTFITTNLSGNRPEEYTNETILSVASSHQSESQPTSISSSTNSQNSLPKRVNSSSSSSISSFFESLRKRMRIIGKRTSSRTIDIQSESIYGNVRKSSKSTNYWCFKLPEE